MMASPVLLNFSNTFFVPQIVTGPKKFDAVKMMREIRDKLSDIYSKDPEAEKKDLEAIRRKYGIKG
jgi:hypothetical protein